jgi:hypothetical protein
MTFCDIYVVEVFAAKDNLISLKCNATSFDPTSSLVVKNIEQKRRSGALITIRSNTYQLPLRKMWAIKD